MPLSRERRSRTVRLTRIRPTPLVGCSGGLCAGRLHFSRGQHDEFPEEVSKADEKKADGGEQRDDRFVGSTVDEERSNQGRRNE